MQMIAYWHLCSKGLWLRSHHLKCGIGSKKAQVRCAVRILPGKGWFYLKSLMDISHLTSREKCGKKVIHLMDNELLACEICILGAFCTFNVNSSHKVCPCGTRMPGNWINWVRSWRNLHTFFMFFWYIYNTVNYRLLYLIVGIFPERLRNIEPQYVQFNLQK